MISLNQVLVATDFGDASDVALQRGRHGRAAIARLLIGSVAGHVVLTAHCPVLTVRHPGRDSVVPDAPHDAANHEPGGL